MSAGIPQDVAAWLQCAMFAGNERDSFLEVRYRLPGRGGMGQEWWPVAEFERAAVFAIERGLRSDVYVSACPRVTRRGRAEDVACGWCLWTDCDSEESVRRLREFRPRPSIVNESGTEGRLHAFWPLSHAAPAAAIERANQRLALALLADPKVAGVHSVMRVAGTLNHKHDPSRAVRCVRLELDVFRLPEVVRELEDLPFQVRPRGRTLRPGASATAAAVEGVARVVRHAQPGERNGKLNWAAYVLGAWVAEGSLAPDEVESALFQAAIEVGLGEGEAARTIKSGLEAGVRR